MRRARSEAAPHGSSPAAAVRLDVFLDVSCLFKTRSEAQRACQAGRVRVNGQPGKPHRLVHAGDALEIERGFGVTQQVTIRGVEERSIPKAEARLLYEDHTPRPSDEEVALRRAERVFRAAQAAAGRPDKRQRRAIGRLRGR
jgi:ribosome-associated heat shock protein Hsp15